MTHLIYKSSVPHVMPECPEKTDHPCEQTSDHDCPMCNGYKLALASSIAKAIPVVESDRESVKIECWNIENRKTINGLREIWSEWLPPDDVVFELDAEFETSEQEQTHLCTACRVDCLAALGKGTCKAPIIQVARLKAQTTEKREHLPKRDTSNRDWSEDYDQENGNYQNKCCFCKLLFYGNKHRVVCKQCDSLHPSSPIETNQASEGKWRVEQSEYMGYYLNGEKFSLIPTTSKDIAELQAIASTLNGEVGEQEETWGAFFTEYNEISIYQQKKKKLAELKSKYTIIKKHAMTKEEAEKKAIWLRELNASGYAGILSNGQLVDRREHPEAIPVQENVMFGVVKPKKLTRCGADGLN